MGKQKVLDKFSQHLLPIFHNLLQVLKIVEAAASTYVEFDRYQTKKRSPMFGGKRVFRLIKKELYSSLNKQQVF